MFVYVGGDSFCSERSTVEHWPYLLAELLGCEIKGQGFPGQGWWNTRKDLLAYLNCDESANTQIFVLCHTNINRPLMTMTNGTSEFQEVAKVYHTYMENDEISIWQTSNWYKEINQLLKNKTVLHIPCFRTGQHLQSLLHGIHITPALINFAQVSGQWSNHFTLEQNQKFAQQLYQIITDKQSTNIQL